MLPNHANNMKTLTVWLVKQPAFIMKLPLYISINNKLSGLWFGLYRNLHIQLSLSVNNRISLPGWVFTDWIVFIS